MQLPVSEVVSGPQETWQIIHAINYKWHRKREKVIELEFRIHTLGNVAEVYRAESTGATTKEYN